ncbi:transposase, partial [Thermovibrio sp.]
MEKSNLKPNIRRGRTCVYNCNYHIVFSTKYRRKVLTPEVEDYLKRVVVEIG